MLKRFSACIIGFLATQPALADGMITPRYHFHHRGYILPAERHVVEVVQPPWSGKFIINGHHFVGTTPACFSWAAGERITLVAGDWHGHCVNAVFYNLQRHSTCTTWCGNGPY
ncbi:MAG: hypothetical protein ACJ8F3_09475 [Xanthobacteraceae bacterium]